MSARKNLRIAVALAAVAALFGVGVAMTPATASAEGCTVTCYKHPITGELICTPPCP
ncbi:hypothetical protein JY651_40110 [Pyxidicoccus parkwayensis]|jgi:hypothetical protein|uniref:Uncharacterized protein n=1 Tax=Pyxidicoccus parkwayensis TaxID=2813578 RepID=A0ABX7NR31_9BACT|nr:hypothetical protein [Pyxidicoccus parkwaysis]QSQ21329.1 hypothetical protein JY651_40110 [Pyxidicoccus parkwaysis]